MEVASVRDRGFWEFGEKLAEPKQGLVAWSQELETGVGLLDQQHRRYIELLNDYLEMSVQKLDTEQKARRLVESFEFLRQYAEEHFSAENSIMLETAYPEFDPHLQEHQLFTSKVEQLARDMERDGHSAKLAREVEFYAIEWFIDHILDSDMKLARFLQDRNLRLQAVDSLS